MTVLVPVTLPLHVFSCFRMSVLVVDAVTVLGFAAVSGECCLLPCCLALAGPTGQAPCVVFLGVTAWHVTLASSSWQRWGEKGCSASCSAVCPSRKRTYALDSLHRGGVGVPAPQSPPWCGSYVPGLEQCLGEPLFPPRPSFSRLASPFTSIF